MQLVHKARVCFPNKFDYLPPVVSSLGSGIWSYLHYHSDCGLDCKSLLGEWCQKWDGLQVQGTFHLCGSTTTLK